MFTDEFIFDLQRFAVISNNTANTLVSGTNGNDSVSNGYYGNNVTIKTGTGNDSITNNGFNVTIDGGADNDYIYNYGSQVSINSGAGNDSIRNSYYGNDVTINGGKGNDSIYNYVNNMTVDAGKGNDSIYNYDGDEVSIVGGDGNDSIYNYYGNNVTIVGGDGNDTIYNYSGSNVTIDVGAGNDFISLSGGTNITVNGSAGNDTIKGSGTNVLYTYDEGDGNDRIEGISEIDTLQIGGGKGTYSSQVSGSDVIVTVGDGKITLVGAASKSIYIEGKKSSAAKNSWKIDGTTATYGTSGNTLITVKGVKNLDGISLSGKVVTVSEASLNQKKVTISGDGYTLKLGSDVTTPATKKAAWTYKSGTATYKSSSKTAGYTLASDSKSISYSKATTAETLATVKGVKSLDGISLSGKVVTVSEASLNAKKVTISGDGYTLKLGSDVTKSVTKKAAWTYKSGTATYKSSSKTAGYKLASNSKSISYSKATTAETLATVKGAKSKSGLSVSGKKITLKNSALKNKVTVSGSYEFDFTSDYKNATITGSSNADTITARGTKVSVNGGKGDDTIKILGSGTVSGGDGADIFYYKSSGSNVIDDYAAEDKISIASGTANISASGNDLIFTIGSGKISVTGGANQTVTYFDADGEHIYKKNSDSGKIITLSEDYDEETYTMGNKLRTVDASAVELDLKIVGNKFANSIVGSGQNDTLIGGKANDTLFGGDGADVFVWNKGDGNDKILDYAEEDMVSITGDTVKNFSASSDDIIFTLASKSKITITGGKDKLITYVDAEGEHIYPKIYTVKGKTITLTEEYTKNDFDVSDYGNYKNINAAEVNHGLNIVGNNSANSITGTSDADTIDGGANNDTIRGGIGNDSIFGNAGNDYLYGGDGNDTLWGGKGNDDIYGGGKKTHNVFIYYPGEGIDTIFDYKSSTDKIVVPTGQVDAVSENKDGDLVFTIGNGEIVLAGWSSKRSYVEVVNGNGEVLKNNSSLLK